MDIIPFAMTVFGAFGAGVTVGALGFSPRLVTRTGVRPEARKDAPPVVYVATGDPSAGYVMTPAPAALPVAAPGVHYVTPVRLTGEHLPSITSTPAPRPGAAFESGEGQR